MSERDLAAAITAAVRAANDGWYVFPVQAAKKVPIIPRGALFDEPPPVAPWAADLLRETDDGWALAAEGSYLASRDPAFVEVLFRQAWRYGPCRAAVTSDLLVVDADHTGRLPGERLRQLDAMPHLRSPSGGLHFFGSAGASNGLPPWRVGAFHHPETGEHIGDLKHLSGRGYTVAYDGLPAYAEAAAAEYGHDLLVWLAAARNTRAAGGAAGGPAAADDAGEYDPLVLAGMEPQSGCHEYLLAGTGQDARRRVDRREIWAQALAMGPGRTEQEAEAEAANAMDGARRKFGWRVFGSAAADEPPPDAPPDPAPGALLRMPPRAEPEPEFDPDTVAGLVAALEHVGITPCYVQPNRHFGLIFAGEDEPQRWLVRNAVDDRAVVALWEGAKSKRGGRFEIAKIERRRAMFSEACRRNPMIFGGQIDEDRAWLDAALVSCPGRTCIEHLVKAAGVLDKYESGAQSPRLAAVAVDVLKRRGWSCSGVRRGYWHWVPPTRRTGRVFGRRAGQAQQPTPQQGWVQGTGLRARSTWDPPAIWPPEDAE